MCVRVIGCNIQGDYFGEMALLLDEPRHANVVAMESVEVLSLEKVSDFRLHKQHG